MRGAGEIRLDTRKLDALLSGLASRAEAVLDKGAADLEAATKEEIVAMDVVDSGALLNSVHVESTHPPLQRTVADAVEYGVYQHEGWHDRAGNYHPGRPFMANAVDRIRRPFQQAWEALFR